MKKNVFYPVFLTLFAFLVVYFSAYFSQNAAFVIDDFDFGVYYDYNEKFYDVLFKNAYNWHGGGYFALFWARFFNFTIPLFLNIHPADFIGFPEGIIKGIFGVFIISITAKYSQIFYKSKILNVVSLIFCALLFFCLGLNFDSVFLSNAYFYRYPMSLLYFALFWYFIYLHITGLRKDKNFLKIGLLSLCAFALGSCLETAIFSSLLLVFLLIFYNFILNVICRLKKDLSETISKYKYVFDVNFYISSFVLYISAFLFLVSGSFQNLASDRGLSAIKFNFPDLREFIGLYNKICFCDELIYWIIFIIFYGIATYFAFRQKEIKNILFPLLMNISVLAVMFSLYFCGKTMYGQNQFWILRLNLIAFYKMQLYLALFILIGYVLKNVKHPKAFLVSFVILALPLLYNVKETYDIYIEENIKRYTIKQENYIAEKILRFYLLQNKTGLVDYEYKKAFCGGLPYWSNNTDINDNNQKYNIFTSVYYPLIYKDNKAFEIGYDFVDDAVRLYEEAGGVFSEDELKNIKFNRLKDDSFVLNIK